VRLDLKKINSKSAYVIGYLDVIRVNKEKKGYQGSRTPPVEILFFFLFIFVRYLVIRLIILF
jgi:hypothetical protein